MNPYPGEIWLADLRQKVNFLDFPQKNTEIIAEC